MLLAGKIVWVTGASRGIGRASAIECARAGATLILSARSEAGLSETADHIRALGACQPHVIVMDVADLASIKKAFQTVHGRLKRVDVLVNNAGILRDALIGMITDADLQETIRVNAFSVIHLTQYVCRMMKQQRSGSIINMASIIGRTGNEGQMIYAASKAAVIAATKSAARELAPTGVRVNAIAPGVIDTAMIASIPPAKLEELRHCIKLGRLGTAEEVARVVLFLASDLSSYITGQVIGVDGGMWL